MGKVKLTDGPAGWGPATVKATEKFVRDELAGMDGSHDWWHIDRVRRIALEIAKAEGSNGEEHFHVIVELSALLHEHLICIGAKDHNIHWCVQSIVVDRDLTAMPSEFPIFAKEVQGKCVECLQ